MSTIEITNKAREYKELQIMIKELEDAAAALRADITAHMDAQGVDTLQADIFIIRNTAYTSQRVDAIALRKELPDIAARYTKAIETRRFAIA